MALEIEIKVKVPSLDPIREKILANGAELIADQEEHDLYYNAPHRDFAVTDEALRIRYLTNQICGKAMPPNVTYKGPKVGREGFKSREELIVDLSSAEEYCTILERLGFRLTAEVVKHREMYQCENALVTLDTLPGIGTFSEIEASFDLSEDEAIAVINETAEMAGIVGERLTKSYLEILLDSRTTRISRKHDSSAV